MESAVSSRQGWGMRRTGDAQREGCPKLAQMGKALRKAGPFGEGVLDAGWRKIILRCRDWHCRGRW